MNNDLLWIVFAIINFVLLLIMYRLFGRLGLFVWVGMATVLANIQVTKTIELFGLTATMGNIIYGTIFLASDILNENYGKKIARKAVGLGFFHPDHYDNHHADCSCVRSGAKRHCEFIP